MRRAYLLAAGTGLAVVAGLTAHFAWPSRSPADPPRPATLVAHVAAAPSETSVPLPIGQVVLFSSGVGYFQREGVIDGDARVDLSFPTQDINDLILGGNGKEAGQIDKKRLAEVDARRKAASLGFLWEIDKAALSQDEYRAVLQRGLADNLNLGGSGVSTMATATKLGDFFQYAIDKAVTLPRQKSALLPIVNKDVEGTRCSIYNEQTQAKFPLLGLKFKNTSGLHLMQGPITVFEGSNYAGDARILDLEPNEERLLSYAVDLGTEVNPVLAADNGRFTVVNYSQGLLYTASKDRQTKTYTIVNRNSDDRVVLIEHPVRNDFHLTDTDKPAETASDVYRFEVKVPAGKTKVQTVTEEHDFIVQYHLTDLDDDAIRRFQSAPVASPAMKKGLQQALDLREAVRKTQREIAELQLQLKTITDDQERLRANLKEMPPTAAAYKRYLDKFDAQETQIEKYQADIKAMQETAHQRQKDFEDFLNTFSAV